MEISNSQFAHRAHTVSAPHFHGTSARSTTLETNRFSTPVRDEISFSPEAQSFSEIASVSPSTSSASSAAPRLDLINRVRAEIAAGTYDSDDKFEAALSRMLGPR